LYQTEAVDELRSVVEPSVQLWWFEFVQRRADVSWKDALGNFGNVRAPLDICALDFSLRNEGR
jgi:hypothetical protein